MSRFSSVALPAALVLAAGVFVPALSTAHAAAAGHPHAPATSHTAAAVPAQQLWLHRYPSQWNSGNSAAAAAAVLSPDGTRVFVTGMSSKGYSTLAYSTATGARLWLASYRGPGQIDNASSVAVSPDGTMVFVTGRSLGTASVGDYATLAYNAATGAQLWAKRYNGPGNDEDAAASVAVSPDGKTVFVTGSSQGSGSGSDYATIAYNAATGAQLWAKRYSGPGNGDDQASSLTVSPNGRMVVITGESQAANGYDYQTIAYNAATGAWLWGSRYNGTGNGDDSAYAVKVTPDSGTVLVTGSSHGKPADSADWATVAYRATTGAQLWVKRYDSPGDFAHATALAIDPEGTRAFVTGFGYGTNSMQDYTTIAYRVATGAQLWLKRYNGPVNLPDIANAVTTSPDGTKVFITGSSHGGGATLYDYMTIGYKAATGAWLWGARYNGPDNLQDIANAVVASRTRVIVTGQADLHEGMHSYSNATTIAYTP